MNCRQFQEPSHQDGFPDSYAGASVFEPLMVLIGIIIPFASISLYTRGVSVHKIEQIGNESIHLTETKYGLCDRITNEDLACSLIGKVIVCSEISPYNSR